MPGAGATWGPAAPPSPGGEGPRILVVFAGLHGSTREIAARLARSLTCSGAGRRIGLTAALVPAQQRPDPAPFDAVVLGSAVYGGRWLAPAVSYLETYAATLARRSTWSFSSGLCSRSSVPPLGVEPSPLMHVSIGPRQHRWFAGRLERRLLSAGERRALEGHPPSVDHRDWQGVHQWADEIAGALKAADVRSRRHDVA
ncbi:flavodoxin domain-containing protein [Blastococcus sp. DSM 46792]|uniref:Flavodoxin domain-containing protein n=2 Tax=Blastococcus goldschmidtiae TaxID=3075546 RepID=A0ABU2K3L2_9ACTN|nr:flavodoxin domain-containing protein [Blastococcus sp. DSM 46792]